MKHLSEAISIRLIFVLFAAILLTSVAVLAAQTGTVTLKDGTVFENVTITTDKTYKVIEFKLRGKKKAFSFNEIESIVDQDGNDITEEVVGSYYRTEMNDEFLSEQSKAYRHARRRLWKTAFSLGGNYNIPSGDYYEDINAGLGFDVDFTVALTYRIALRLQVSYNGMDYPDDLAYIIGFQDGERAIMYNLNFSSMSYFASFQYYYRPDRETPGKVIWHLYSGLGAVTHKLESDAVLILSDGTELVYPEGSYSETKFAGTLGGGMTYMVGEAIGIYWAAGMDMVALGTAEDSDDWDPVDDVVWAHQFDLKTGLTFFIK